ncbi:MAG: Cof-type HAD-IIB family hydrolase [Candidatus Humimicrobiaceae bacterium]
MIAVDLDGTLFDSRSKISTQNFKAIEKCRNKGIKVVIASAKPPLIVGRLAAKMKLDTAQISYSGALIFKNHDEVILKLKISKAQCLEIIKYCREWDRGLTIGVSNGLLYYEKKHPYLKIVTNSGDRIAKIEDIASEEIINDAIMFSLSGYENDGFEDFLKKTLNSRTIKIVRGSPESIIIFNGKANKFFAVRRIMEKYEISREELMAIGDSNNDFEMIQFAGMSIAMGNAVEDLKKIASHVVPDNDSSGVAYAINNYAF